MIQFHNFDDTKSSINSTSMHDLIKLSPDFRNFKLVIFTAEYRGIHSSSRIFIKEGFYNVSAYKTFPLGQKQVLSLKLPADSVSSYIHEQTMIGLFDFTCSRIQMRCFAKRCQHHLNLRPTMTTT